MVTVFKNGHVYTMNREMPFVTAVAVEDDKIVYVGSDEGAAAYEAKADKVVDLNGKMLTPGFTDAHCHPMLSAFLTSGMLFDAEMTHEDVIEGIKAYVAEHPEQENYFGLGYPEWVFDENGPQKTELDAICPDKPMFILSNGGHEAWANSKTFEVLGIDKNFPDPNPGHAYFHRDAEGNPTGVVVEAAEKIILKGLPWFSADAVTDIYHELFANYASLGVTSFTDCGIFDTMEEQALEIVGRFERSGELKQRICGCTFVQGADQLPDSVENLKKLREAHNNDLFKMSVLKIVNDGTTESQTAAMLYPDGTDVTPVNHGESLYAKCLEAAANGFDIHIHAIGSRAIHETLMAAKAVREAGYFDTRIINAHTHLTEPADKPLFAKYNVCVNTSSIWHYFTPEAAPVIGDWADHQFEMQSIVKHGARLTLGSDFPFDEMGTEPLKGIQMGVTRQLVGEPDMPVMVPADERLTVQQCLEAYTINAAYAMHWDDKFGSIEVGKYADLVVLEKDLCEIDPQDIFATPVLLTMMGGQVTYQNEAFAF